MVVRSMGGGRGLEATFCPDCHASDRSTSPNRIPVKEEMALFMTLTTISREEDVMAYA